VVSDEGENLLANGGISAHASIPGESASEWIQSAALVAHACDDNPRSQIGGWTVEGDGGERGTGKALLDSLTQPWRRWLPFLAHGSSTWQRDHERFEGVQ